MLSQILIFMYSSVAITQAQIVWTYTEDLVDEYYTTTPTITADFLPQDEKDVQAIIDSDRNEQAIAGILLYREKIRRYAISLTKIPGTYAYTSGKQSYTVDYWVTDTYSPQRNKNSTSTFMDLCFGLIEDENVVLGNYLGRFLDLQDETWVIIGMVLTKDIRTMIRTYDLKHGITFKNLRKYQRHPFENMLRRWVRHNREPVEKENLDHNQVMLDTNALKIEQQDGGWHEKREQIERILMWKSIKYVRAVILEFEKLNGGKSIEDIIQDNVKAKGLNRDLANAYASIDTSRININISPKYCENIATERIMCIAVVHPQEWPKVDQAFKKDNKDDSLTKFILEKLTTDKIMAEMIALTIDPMFKPTTFTGKSIQDNVGKPPSMLPTVPPTTLAPSF